MGLVDNARKAELAQELRAAGYYRATVLLEYAALRVLLIATPLFAAVLATLIVDLPLVPWVLGAGAILALLGFSVPRAFINYRAWRRGLQIERGLPVAVDLLSLCSNT